MGLFSHCRDNWLRYLVGIGIFGAVLYSSPKAQQAAKGAVGAVVNLGYELVDATAGRALRWGGYQTSPTKALPRGKGTPATKAVLTLDDLKVHPSTWILYDLEPKHFAPPYNIKPPARTIALTALPEVHDTLNDALIWTRMAQHSLPPGWDESLESKLGVYRALREGQSRAWIRWQNGLLSSMPTDKEIKEMQEEWSPYFGRLNQYLEEADMLKNLGPNEPLVKDGKSISYSIPAEVADKARTLAKRDWCISGSGRSDIETCATEK